MSSAADSVVEWPGVLRVCQASVRAPTTKPFSPFVMIKSARHSSFPATNFAPPLLSQHSSSACNAESRPRRSFCTSASLSALFSTNLDLGDGRWGPRTMADTGSHMQGGGTCGWQQQGQAGTLHHSCTIPDSQRRIKEL